MIPTRFILYNHKTWILMRLLNCWSMEPVRSVTSCMSTNLTEIFPVSWLSFNYNHYNFCRSSTLFPEKRNNQSWVIKSRAMRSFRIVALKPRSRICTVSHDLTISAVRLPVNEFWTRSHLPRNRTCRIIEFLNASKGSLNLLSEISDR